MTMPNDHNPVPPPERSDKTDFSRPPTGHHAGETGEAARSKTQGPDHMRDELNPSTAGDRLNKGQKEREREWNKKP